MNIHLGGERQFFGRRALDHTGLHAGAGAAIATLPAEELDVVCLSNTETGFFTMCAKDVAGIVLGESVPLPPVANRVSISTDKLRCFEGDYRANEQLAFTLKISEKNLLFSWLDPRETIS